MLPDRTSKHFNVLGSRWSFMLANSILPLDYLDCYASQPNFGFRESECLGANTGVD